jgi:hypothetical protein
MATVGMVGYPPRQIRQHQPRLKPHLYELDHATLLDGGRRPKAPPANFWRKITDNHANIAPACDRP